MANPMPNANQIKLFSSIPFYLFSFDEIVKADLKDKEVLINCVFKVV